MTASRPSKEAAPRGAGAPSVLLALVRETMREYFAPERFEGVRNFERAVNAIGSRLPDQGAIALVDSFVDRMAARYPADRFRGKLVFKLNFCDRWRVDFVTFARNRTAGAPRKYAHRSVPVPSTKQTACREEWPRCPVCATPFNEKRAAILHRAGEPPHCDCCQVPRSLWESEGELLEWIRENLSWLWIRSPQGPWQNLLD